jgi:hypothetical protein
VAGWILIGAGAVLTGFYIGTSFRITMPVPVLFSAFMEVKYFTSFPTNVADELTMLTLLLGFFMVVFSKEKPGGPDSWEIKGKALFKALYVNCIILFLSIIFIYGQGFLAVLLLNSYSIFILYMVFLYRMKVKERSSNI